jgi:hypothetical protein
MCYPPNTSINVALAAGQRLRYRRLRGVCVQPQTGLLRIPRVRIHATSRHVGVPSDRRRGKSAIRRLPLEFCAAIEGHTQRWILVCQLDRERRRSGNASTFVVMDQDRTVVANFTGCAINISGRGTAGTTMTPPRIDLTWAPNGADHANVFRSATTGGPYAFVGASTTKSFTDTTSGLVNNRRRTTSCNSSRRMG